MGKYYITRARAIKNNIKCIKKLSGIKLYILRNKVLYCDVLFIHFLFIKNRLF